MVANFYILGGILESTYSSTVWPYSYFIPVTGTEVDGSERFMPNCSTHLSTTSFTRSPKTSCIS